MTKDLDITEVAFYDETGRDSLLGTFHGWVQRDGAWFGHVMVYGPEGQHRATVPAERLLVLDYCGRLPSGEVRHRCEGHDLLEPDQKVWA